MGYIDDPTGAGELRELKRRVSKLETASPLGNSSISRGQLRVASNEGLLVQGSAKVEGWLIVTGTERVTGTLEVLGELIASGTISLTGPLTQTGDSTFVGDIDITGNLHIDGTTTLTKTMTVNSPGKIVFPGGPSPLTLESGEMSFGSGGRIDGTSGLRMQLPGGGFISLQAGIAQMVLGSNYVAVASGGTTIGGNLGVGGNVTATGTITGSSKTFRIPHPLKAETWLLHGVTESPVHGVEYWGDETLDENGMALVALPDYFEALTVQDGRAVLVTGRGFSPDWGDIEDGSFLVSGTPGGKFSWLVKAARADVTLAVEVPMTEEELLAHEGRD